MNGRSTYFTASGLRTVHAVLRKRWRRAFLPALGVMLIGALLATTLVRSSPSLVLGIAITIIIVSLIVAGSVKEVRRSYITLRRFWRQLNDLIEGRVTELERSHTLLVLALQEGGRLPDGPYADFISTSSVAGAVPAMVQRGHVLHAYAIAGDAAALRKVDKSTLRILRRELRDRGYLSKAREVAEVCAEVTDTQSDRFLLAHIQGELAVLSGEVTPVVESSGEGFRPHPGRILHLVGSSLLERQTGYTLRTHYTAVAQRAAGLDPHVATQMGVPNRTGDFTTESLDGIVHHRLPGPARGVELLDRWLEQYVQQVANLARKVRPAVLHAASDFVNAWAAEIVGGAFGIPVVYESRGFWEETWLSRHARRYGWDLSQVEARYGLPDAYLKRREIEDLCRRRAGHVVTLADVMADRIESAGVARDRITVIPNGVDINAFAVQPERNTELASRLGISLEAVVIGYVSSLVEYEGVDILIDAYAAAKASSPGPVALLIVGEGPERQRLMHQAADLGLDDAVFTGQVPHSAVHEYYSLIDIFVVPRRPLEVCHLVTPLKPFEALSTGRTVVLANVRALVSIARQSRAVELFEAGDATSLATVLIGLLKKPERRRELAATGAAWVRTERSWASNASSYLRLYEQLGVIPRSVDRIQQLTADSIDVEHLRQGLAKRPPLPFEVLSVEDTDREVQRLMTEGWSHGIYPRVQLDLPIDWTNLCASNRSWAFLLHSWDFMAPVLAAYAQTEEISYLTWCIERAVSWAQAFNDSDGHGTMAWYDMSLGLRGHRLAYLVEQALLHCRDITTISTLLSCVVRHQKEYVAEETFNPRNNHGVYVALGELALARRLREVPGMDVLETQGRERLDLMVRSQFAVDGGHLEHSPDYHRMLVDSFSGALQAGLVDDEEVRRRISLAEEVLGWFIQPNGELAQIGDSPARQMRSARARTSNPATEFLVSRGRRGNPNDCELRILPHTGYAIVRSPQPVRTDDHDSVGYLLLAGGFHSRAHKHADDLTIIWFDRGREILIDAGRYGYVDLLPRNSPLRKAGYYYSAPERQYVESTRAHNTVEADAVDHVRRNRKPYGSAIQDAEKRDGHFRIRSEVHHGTWSHRRELIFRPGMWLYVLDFVLAEDGNPHDFRVWWNLPADAVPSPTPKGVRVDLPGVMEAMWMNQFAEVSLIAPATAQRDPLRGWRSKAELEFTPAWSTGFEALSVRKANFRTLFSFGDRPLKASVEHPFIVDDRVF